MAYNLKVLGKMMEIIDKQILDHFKESFQSKKEVQLFENKGIDIVKEKAWFWCSCLNQNCHKPEALLCWHLWQTGQITQYIQIM